MSFVKDLLGGILITLVAGAVAVAQNAVRRDGIPLVPRVSASKVGKQEAPMSSATDTRPGGRNAVEDPAVVGAVSVAPTTEELASGLISADRLKELMDSGDSGRIVLIDARLPREFETGHIAGAINVPYERLPEHYAALARTVPLGAMIVCYCQSETCDDSENLARELKFMGYQNVMLYKGGWDEWSRVGYPAAGAAKND